MNRYYLELDIVNISYWLIEDDSELLSTQLEMFKIPYGLTIDVQIGNNSCETTERIFAFTNQQSFIKQMVSW